MRYRESYLKVFYGTTSSLVNPEAMRAALDSNPALLSLLQESGLHASEVVPAGDCCPRALCRLVGAQVVSAWLGGVEHSDLQEEGSLGRAVVRTGWQ